jgi:hypothetical protein
MVPLRGHVPLMVSLGEQRPPARLGLDPRTIHRAKDSEAILDDNMDAKVMVQTDGWCACRSCLLSHDSVAKSQNAVRLNFR